MSDYNSIIILQEVSLCLLLKIKDVFKDKTVFFHQLTENEYLVTITPNCYNKENWEQNDISNGFLSVKKDNLRIINTHLVPQRYTKHKVMEYIFNLPNDINTIVGGDFNESWKRTKIALESRYVLPFFGNTYKKSQIDHIIFDKNFECSYKAERFLCEKISDHNLVKIIFEN